MMVCLCVLSMFFFFKQKTAYEMRISDWSSDVCSSDLVRHRTETLDARGVILCAGDPVLDRAIIVQLALVQVDGDHLAGAEATLLADARFRQQRSEERRVGKECVSTCRSRWSP